MTSCRQHCLFCVNGQILRVLLIQNLVYSSVECVELLWTLFLDPQLRKTFVNFLGTMLWAANITSPLILVLYQWAMTQLTTSWILHPQELSERHTNAPIQHFLKIDIALNIPAVAVVDSSLVGDVIFVDCGISRKVLRRNPARIVLSTVVKFLSWCVAIIFIDAAQELSRSRTSSIVL